METSRQKGLLRGQRLEKRFRGTFSVSPKLLQGHRQLLCAWAKECAIMRVSVAQPLGEEDPVGEPGNLPSIPPSSWLQPSRLLTLHLSTPPGVWTQKFPRESRTKPQFFHQPAACQGAPVAPGPPQPPQTLPVPLPFPQVPKAPGRP